MTRRSDILQGVERQLLALVALPGQPVGASSLAGPRHLLRVVAAVVQDGDPVPVVGLDGDGDVQCQWVLDGAVVTVVVDDSGSGWVWARGADGTELLYEEWTRAQRPRAALSAAGALLRRDEARQPCS